MSVLNWYLIINEVKSRRKNSTTFWIKLKRACTVWWIKSYFLSLNWQPHLLHVQSIQLHASTEYESVVQANIALQKMRRRLCQTHFQAENSGNLWTVRSVVSCIRKFKQNGRVRLSNVVAICTLYIPWDLNVQLT